MKRILAEYAPAHRERKGAPRDWLLYVNGASVRDTRGVGRRFTTEILAMNAGVKIVRKDKDKTR